MVVEKSFADIPLEIRQNSSLSQDGVWEVFIYCHKMALSSLQSCTKSDFIRVFERERLPQDKIDDIISALVAAELVIQEGDRYALSPNGQQVAEILQSVICQKMDEFTDDTKGWIEFELSMYQWLRRALAVTA